jgi:hypothetical protein
LGRAALGDEMSCADPDKRKDREVRNDARRFFCAACATEPWRVIVILDTRNGKTVRLFKCECGELIWDD